MGSSHSTIKVPDEQWTWNIAFHNHNNWWLEQLLNLNLWWLVLFRLVVSMFFIPETYIAVKIRIILNGRETCPTAPTRFSTHQFVFDKFFIIFPRDSYDTAMILPYLCWCLITIFPIGFLWFPMASSWKYHPWNHPWNHERWNHGALGAQKKFGLLFHEALVWVANDLAIGTTGEQPGPGPPKIRVYPLVMST